MELSIHPALSLNFLVIFQLRTFIDVLLFFILQYQMFAPGSATTTTTTSIFFLFCFKAIRGLLIQVSKCAAYARITRYWNADGNTDPQLSRSFVTS
jgi:hypothetical protein